MMWVRVTLDWWLSMYIFNVHLNWKRHFARNLMIVVLYFIYSNEIIIISCVSQMAKELDAILDHGEANRAVSCITESGSVSFLEKIIFPIYETLAAVSGSFTIHVIWMYLMSSSLPSKKRTCLSLFMHFVTPLIYMSFYFFITFTNVIFGLPLPFFCSLNLERLTFFNWFITCSSLNVTKPSQVTLLHLFINRGYPYF